MVNFSNRIMAKAVIFDFDGVIVDTEPLHYKSFQMILEPIGLGFSWQDYVETYMGFDDRDAFIEAFASAGKELRSDEMNVLIQQKAILFRKVIQDGVVAYPGVVELIRRLHSEKIPLAISSGALKSDIDPILVILGIEQCFDIIVTADDVTRSKPSPESYQLAFDRLSSLHENSFEKSSTVAIEDTPAGILSARAAGLHVIAVSNSYSPEKLSDATMVTSTLENLLEVS